MEDPHAKLSSQFKRGTTVKAKVFEVNDDNIIVQVKDDVQGIIKKSDLSSDRASQKSELFNIGDKIEAKIISIESSGKLVLSIKALEFDEHKKAIAEYSGNESNSSSSLGDILGAALNK